MGHRGPQQRLIQGAARHGRFLRFEFLKAGLLAGEPFQPAHLLVECQQHQPGAADTVPPVRVVGVGVMFQRHVLATVAQRRVAAEHHPALLALLARR